MKRSVLALTLLVSFLFPTTGTAEWVKVSESVHGNKFYIDSKIRKHGGFIYFWPLADYPKLILKQTVGNLESDTFRSLAIQNRWAKAQLTLAGHIQTTHGSIHLPVQQQKRP